MSKSILLCCGAGMSSGFLAQKAQKAASSKGYDYSVSAKSQSVVPDILEDYDLLLLGPHYESYLEEFEEMAEEFDIPVRVIPQDIYGNLDGEALIDFAIEALER